MEFVAAGWCIMKWLRLDQTIRNLICSDLEILLVVIRLGVNELKKKQVCVPPGLVWGKGGGWVVLFSVCVYI